MLVHTACEALRSGHVLELRYVGYSRFIEVHVLALLKTTTPFLELGKLAAELATRNPVTRSFCA
jgi:hypothetical protein